MNYLFGREFQQLVLGSKDSPAYHGQATLPKWLILGTRLIRSSKQSHFWQPDWFLQEHLGEESHWSRRSMLPDGGRDL
jgi:hypothetical protein